VGDGPHHLKVVANTGRLKPTLWTRGDLARTFDAAPLPISREGIPASWVREGILAPATAPGLAGGLPVRTDHAAAMRVSFILHG
jgi:hypothetical protein